MEDYLRLEKHHRANEHTPIDKFTYKEYEVCISDGGPYTDARKRFQYPNGWYESSFTIMLGGVAIIEAPLEFDFLHDITMTNESRRLGRVNAAKQAARTIIDDWEQQGFKIDVQSIRRKKH